MALRPRLSPGVPLSRDGSALLAKARYESCQAQRSKARLGVRRWVILTPTLCLVALDAVPDDAKALPINGWHLHHPWRRTPEPPRSRKLAHLGAQPLD